MSKEYPHSLQDSVVRMVLHLCAGHESLAPFVVIKEVAPPDKGSAV